MVSHFVQVIVVHTICNWIRISYFAALLATNLFHQFCLPKISSLCAPYCVRKSEFALDPSFAFGRSSRTLIGTAWQC